MARTKLVFLCLAVILLLSITVAPVITITVQGTVAVEGAWEHPNHHVADVEATPTPSPVHPDCTGCSAGGGGPI